MKVTQNTRNFIKSHSFRKAENHCSRPKKQLKVGQLGARPDLLQSGPTLTQWPESDTLCLRHAGSILCEARSLPALSLYHSKTFSNGAKQLARKGPNPPGRSVRWSRASLTPTSERENMPESPAFQEQPTWQHSGLCFFKDYFSSAALLRYSRQKQEIMERTGLSSRGSSAPF